MNILHSVLLNDYNCVFMYLPQLLLMTHSFVFLLQKGGALFITSVSKVFHSLFLKKRGFSVSQIIGSQPQTTI